jgi:dTDP-4-amino-4,6-dideoxygalactose transaminase
MKTLIPMSSADLTAADVQAVADVVRSGRLVLGPQTREL